MSAASRILPGFGFAVAGVLLLLGSGLSLIPALAVQTAGSVGSIVSAVLANLASLVLAITWARLQRVRVAGASVAASVVLWALAIAWLAIAIYGVLWEVVPALSGDEVGWIGFLVWPLAILLTLVAGILIAIAATVPSPARWAVLGLGILNVAFMVLGIVTGFSAETGQLVSAALALAYLVAGVLYVRSGSVTSA